MGTVGSRHIEAERLGEAAKSEIKEHEVAMALAGESIGLWLHQSLLQASPTAPLPKPLLHPAKIQEYEWRCYKENFESYIMEGGWWRSVSAYDSSLLARPQTSMSEETDFAALMQMEPVSEQTGFPIPRHKVWETTPPRRPLQHEAQDQYNI
mmetsp:Transcript_43617/g.64065  ORF Transcript_43617/g.64065 Transcript_43617/m.64065 type:complete len:152 (+) Transcript_43617:94-549(+)